MRRITVTALSFAVLAAAAALLDVISNGNTAFIAPMLFLIAALVALTVAIAYMDYRHVQTDQHVTIAAERATEAAENTARNLDLLEEIEAIQRRTAEKQGVPLDDITWGHQHAPEQPSPERPTALPHAPSR